MTYLQFVGGGYEFSAIPEARSKLDGGEIDDGRDNENDPSDEGVRSLVVLHMLDSDGPEGSESGVWEDGLSKALDHLNSP